MNSERPYVMSYAIKWRLRTVKRRLEKAYVE